MAQLNDLLVVGASRLLNGLGVLGNANTDSIFPNITDTYNLGSSDKRWNLLYAKTLNTYQETTDILTVNTKATIGNGAGSTSATTGSLIVKGGIGVNANSYFGGTITSSKFIGPLQGNADSASLLKTCNSNTSIATSVWRGNITDGVVVWGENFKNKTDIGNDDTGDITLWLKNSGSAATLNMSIDGNYYAGGHNPVLNSINYTNYTVTKAGSGASGTWSISISGNAATATALTSSAGNTGQPVYFTGGKPATIDWHIGNSGVGEHNANNVTYNFCGYYTSNGPATSLGASRSDGALYAQAYNSTWVAQIAQDYRNGNLFIRGKNNGTWQSWKAILTSDYRPMVFHWSGQSGQPTWLWGGENGVDMYVYNPSNFVVAGASYLKDKTNGTATYLNYGASGMSSASWYGAWDGYTLRAISPANLANHLASTALNSIYLKYNGWWDGSDNSLNVNNASGMIFAYSNHGLPGYWGVVTTLEYQYNAAYKHQIYGDGWNNIMYFRTASSDRGGFNAWKRLWAQGDAVTGAVWNDYAEHREADTIESGYVLAETGQDSLTKTTERLQHFAGVSSDTWGFSQGETEKAKTPIAVAGRVLVYTYQNRNNYKPGDCVCAAPGGTVDIMTREEVILWPDRVVGTVSQVPDYDEWGGGDMADRSPVKINGRIWIKVK